MFFFCEACGAKQEHNTIRCEKCGEPLVFLHAPPNERELDDLYVFCSIDESGLRGICAHVLPGVGSMPLLTGSPNAAESLKNVALSIAAQTGLRVAMYKFTRGEELWSTDATH